MARGTRMVSHSVSLNPNQARIGTLEIRGTYKLSTAAVAGHSIVFGEYHTAAQPILFYPMRDLGSVRSASLFFSGKVAEFLGRDQHSIAPITLPMALEAFRVFMSGGRTRGLQICAEFEVVFESPGFLDGGSLVLDSLTSPPESDYADGILPNFVVSNSARFEAAGFVDGGVMVLDSLPYPESFDHVERPTNFVGPNPRNLPEFAAAGILDGGSLVLDALPSDDENVFDPIPDFEDSDMGMTEEEISGLKKVKQSCVGRGTCSVCLDDFSPGDLITPLTLCSHSFHADCIATWLRRNRSCPMCRTICTAF